MPEMTAAEALARAWITNDPYGPWKQGVEKAIDIVARLRTLGFAIVPVEAVPIDTLRRMARAIKRSRYPNMTDAQFDKTCDVSGDDWTYEYLQGAHRAYAAMVAPDAEKGKL